MVEYAGTIYHVMIRGELREENAGTTRIGIIWPTPSASPLALTWPPKPSPSLRTMEDRTWVASSRSLSMALDWVTSAVCVVSPDWLAADRVAVELMGIDYAKVGYLNYCAQAGLGEGDLQKIEVVGASIAQHIKPYKLSDNIEKQLIWMTPPKVI